MQNKTATTSAQRMRKLREKAAEVAWGSTVDSLDEISFSALLELHAAEARKCHSDATRSRVMMIWFVKELNQRLSL